MGEQVLGCRIFRATNVNNIIPPSRKMTAPSKKELCRRGTFGGEHLYLRVEVDAMRKGMNYFGGRRFSHS